MQQTDIRACLAHSLRDVLSPIGAELSLESDKVSLHLSALKKLSWKGQMVDHAFVEKHLNPLGFSRSKNWTWEGCKSVVTPFSTIKKIETMASLLIRENFLSPDFNIVVKPQIASGFDGSASEKDIAELNKLYQDDFIAAEKKPLLLELKKSVGPFLASSGDSEVTLMDAAAQIASLSVGLNDPSRSALLMRPNCVEQEIQDSLTDVQLAYEEILKLESGLENVYFCQSGSESVELALKIFRQKHPARQKIAAFSGSFHGRTLFSLHSTYNPSKREIFEFNSDWVDFYEFPENKKPQEACPEPHGWLEYWENPKNNRDSDSFKKWLDIKDPLLSVECSILERLRKDFQKEPPLCLLIEPMQCEGGDRYASSRFFRALRLMTKAHSVPLVFDEVQTGFGLGEKFFWHKSFNLQDSKGKELLPDAVCIAKKAQLGACLSNETIEHKNEGSLLSLYRGYIQAKEILDFTPNSFERTIRKNIERLQETVGPENLFNPRWSNLCFAFDVADKDIASKLVSKRYKNGLLFYPAGDRTLRFRLMTSSTERDIFQIFSGILGCFLDLDNEGILKLSKTQKDWKALLSKEESQWESPKPRFKEQKKIELKDLSLETLQGLGPDDWRKLFKQLFTHYPQLIYSDWNQSFNLEKLSMLNLKSLYSLYLETPELTSLEFLWQASRLGSASVHRFDVSLIDKYATSIDSLQKEVYEPVRRETIERFKQFAENDRCVFLAALNDNQLEGISVAIPLLESTKVPYLTKECRIKANDSDLYSLDLSIATKAQRKGLGLRLKIEQFLEARRQKATRILSRNRIPESMAMSRLNRRLGSVVIKQKNDEYEGNATAFYQSLNLCDHSSIEQCYIHPERIKNKVCLSNFVSQSYVHHMLSLKSLLPKSLQHVYLSSGRCESIDKMIKILRYHRRDARKALSLKGEFFGENTEACRALSKNSILGWEQLDSMADIEEIEKIVADKDPGSILGFFIEVVSEGNKGQKSISYLKEMTQVFKARKIPVIFNETHSSFFRYHPKQFLAASNPELDCDAVVFYPGHQLGVTAVREELFIKKPLTLISTWDGDEYSLEKLSRKALECWEKGNNNEKY